MKKLNFMMGAGAALLMIGCEKEQAITPVSPEQQLEVRSHLGALAYVSSNTNGQLGIFAIGAAIANPPSVGFDQRTLNLPYADADGVVYDENRNAVYQVNRTGSRLVALDSISYRMNGENVIPSAMGPSTFTNGREATMYNNKVVVADDITPGRLASYHVNTDHISDFRAYDVGFKVWGIQATSKDLWAIKDQSNMVVYFKDFFKAKGGNLPSTSQVGIQGLVRTHGLHYDEAADIMVLTDIGSAASATDGALVVITDFKNKFAAAGNGGMIPLTQQIRIEGNMTELGNPVDVAVKGSAGAIYVAERAQQKFLVFAIPEANCNCAPVYSTGFPGASAVTIDFN